MLDNRGSDMTRERVLLESGRAEYLSQEGTSNELSVKAGSIFLFMIAMKYRKAFISSPDVILDQSMTVHTAGLSSCS